MGAEWPRRLVAPARSGQPKPAAVGKQLAATASRYRYPLPYPLPAFG